jgi:AbiV family abortive infection protein
LENSLRLTENAINISSQELIGFKSNDEFHKSLVHLKRMIESSISLLERNFYNQSLFFSITAIEEIAKIEVCVFRGFKADKMVSRRKDPMFDHSVKHQISSNPVILIGHRLAKALGNERVNDIFEKLHSGEFVKIRENCLYFQRNEQELIIPHEIVDPKLSFEMLLICIEIVDDKFSGLTSFATDIAENLNNNFTVIESMLRENKF